MSGQSDGLKRLTFEFFLLIDGLNFLEADFNLNFLNFEILVLNVGGVSVSICIELRIIEAIIDIITFVFSSA